MISIFFSRRPGNRQGAALFVVLALVVLFTGLAVAFFSRAMSERQVSDSSANQTKVEMLAQGAIDIIVSGLKQEIANGSDITTAGNTAIYTPKASANLAPVRAIMNSSGQITSTLNSTQRKIMPALIRESAADETALSGTAAPSNASKCNSTADVSSNGRRVSLARWNSHYLLLRRTSTASGDRTPPSPLSSAQGNPNPSVSNSFYPPDWVFVTRGAGPAVITAPDNSVIGRYAYAIYDEGGLMDVNVAGFPITTSGSVPAQYATKGALAFADLTQLTDASGKALMSGTCINNLVGWRSYASLQPAGSLSSGGYTFSSGTTPVVNFANLILSNTTGFMRINSSLVSGQTDRAILSRQQMINLLMASGTSNFNPTALMCLGNFSRAVNAPSWSPTTPVPSTSGTCTIDYAAKAATPTRDQSTAVNRDLANVRFAHAATVTHYDDKGNATTYPVQAGDPLLQRRFSLAKVKWLDVTATPSNGPDPARAAIIQACFGLRWNSTKWRWDYAGAAGSTARGSIETLDVVATEDREPNFFELLKAGILAGSLGRDPGPGMDHSAPSYMDNGGVGVYASGFDTYKKAPDLQIIQIGANIIDQYDTDSYPTAIYLAYFPSPGPIDELTINTVYGDENLPCLIGFNAVALADPLPPGGGASGSLRQWVQPQIWNPHQVPAPATTLQGYPTGFRGYAYGQIYGKIDIKRASGSTTTDYSPVTNYDDGTGNVGTPGQRGEIYFNNPPDATSPFYDHPCPLTLDLKTTNGSAIVDTGATPATNCYDSTKGWDKQPPYTTGIDNPPLDQFAGFSLVPYDDFNPDPATDKPHYIMLPNPTVDFSLQYKGTDGNYHPYNFMARICQDLKVSAKHLTSGDNQTVAGFSAISGWGAMRMDPRTDRFSVSTMWWHKNGNEPYQTMQSSGYGGGPSGGGYGDGGDYSIPYLPGVFTYLIGSKSYDPTQNLATGGEIQLWSRNDPLSSLNYIAFASSSTVATDNNAYYSDPDGVVRYGDSYRQNFNTGDGCELYQGTTTIRNSSGSSVTPGTANWTSTTTQPGVQVQSRRPVILNRPFRSVGELGFAYRDLPCKTLDFWSPTSADSALLDLFSVNDQPSVIAGQINPNSAALNVLTDSNGNLFSPVLQAIFSGAAKSDALGVQISGTDSNKVVQALYNDISGAAGLYSNRADLAARLGYLVSDPHNPAKAFDTSQTATANWGNKAYAEAPMRALADVSNTRTWNLMIDVIAQTGKFAPNATSLNSFVVQGERRYWLHIAIDRFSGKIVDQQLEPVYE